MASKKGLTVQPIETSISTAKKLSLTVGILSFCAFIVQGLGQTFGFSGVAEQLTQTFLLFAGGINIWFLGSTSQKITQEKKDAES